jgi:transposase
MPAPMSRDLRERIVRAVEDGSSMRAAAARFAVSLPIPTEVARDSGMMSPAIPI